MNYSMDNKIWRVGGPLFAYLGINFMVELIVYLWIFYNKFKTLDVGAAFNGILYAQQVNETEQIYAVLISGVAAGISIPIFIKMMKNDYEYPVNRRHKERNFDAKRYVKGMNRPLLPILVLVGVFATLGLSRLMLMLPIDGILGDYSEVKETYEAGNVWLQFFVLGIIMPVAEELLFRGIVYSRLKLYYDVTIAAYIAAIVFGVAHFNLVQGLYAFVMGILFTYVYEKSDNILAPAIIHIAANLTSVLTSVNPLSAWIESHTFIKFVIGVIYTVIFIKMSLILYKKLEKNRQISDESEEEKLHKGSEETHYSNDENHKIDFHI